ncbi:hypothetical protein [Solemya velum gill symbiont]|uniref:hypothetical protein n=1 Tax=Solemya velum gill symbiont TaxID=2340 RepID=UPI00117B0FA5|nr:hypothetical protein [Solemya velum gill symbiont]
MKLRLISVATAISALLVVTPAVADKKDGHHKHGGKDSSVIVVRGDRDRVTRHSHKHRHGDRKHVHKHRHGPRYSHHRNGHGHKKGRHHRRDHVRTSISTEETFHITVITSVTIQAMIILMRKTSLPECFSTESLMDLTSIKSKPTCPAILNVRSHAECTYDSHC